MNIKELLSLNIDCDIKGVHNDSRLISEGYLFIAYPGAATDGRLYIQQAVNNGAVAIAYEPEDFPENVTLPKEVITIPIEKLAEHLPSIAARFYHLPSKSLDITGITGTNGKTTIAYQLAQAHELLSQSAFYVGTLGYGKVDSLENTLNTTPDALCLQALLSQCVQDKVQHICMEVSSHALDQGRVDGIDFNQAIFTNLTLDHLDYHHTMENYAQAKSKLFRWPSLKHCIINHDDAYASVMLAGVESEVYTYGMKEGSDVRAVNVEVSMTGTSIDIDSPWGRHLITIRALGYFNIYNALAVFTSLLAYGYSIKDVISVMPRLNAAPGRMEIITEAPYTIVDYAHTPDALENVLATLNKVKKSRIIVVFGCGGDRDVSKRPIMGNIAAQYADVCIITSDNPRSEDPAKIMKDIEQGITSHKAEVLTIMDRKDAIAKAIALAKEDDIVLVAGKGHEAYQQIGSERHPFSDQAVIRDCVEVKHVGWAKER